MARTRIEDAGEKIGGARKDWKAVAMTVGDLATMNNDESVASVVRDNVWPAPDYEALVAAGMTAERAAAIRHMRSKVASSPGHRHGGDVERERRDYVLSISTARGIMEDVSTSLPLRDVQSTVHDALRALDPAPDFRIASARRKAFFGMDFQDRQAIQKLVDAGFPAKVPAWLRGVAIRETPHGWAAVKAGRRIGEYRPTREALVEALRPAPGTPVAKAGRAVPDRPHLDFLVRTGPACRDGDVQAKDFVELLGFRAVEFGNWVAQDERQTLLNHGWEAIHDLADAMGLAPRDISLGGTLAVAFGARGKGGRAAAHYEPGRRVFNMTKVNGAGTLAHEFAHALDHLFGLVGVNGSTVGVRGGTGWYERVRDHRGYLADLDAAEADAWVDLTSAFYVKRPDAERHAADIGRLAEDLTKERDGYAAARERYDAALASGSRKARDVKYEKSYANWMASAARRLEAYGRRIDDVAANGVPDAVRVQTDYYREAAAIGSGDSTYWTRPTEMFARAFESFVFDSLAKAGRRSDYLVHGVEPERYAGDEWKGNAYPTGLEREALNEAMADLVEAVNRRVAELGRQPPDLADAYAPAA